MAIELRRGRPYYYRKRRVDGRVVSEYVGGGTIGQLLATIAQAGRIERDALEGAWRVEREGLEAEDREFAEYFDRVEALTRRMLDAAGYHRPKRQWRKRRAKIQEANPTD